MPESFKTQRYEDRPSSKLGVGDYIAKHVVWLFLPLIGFAAGFALRKVTKLPFLEKSGNTISDLMMNKSQRDAVHHAVTQSGHYVMRRGEVWGGGLGGMYGTYRLWRANTAEQLEVDKINKTTEKLREMESATDYLTNENEQLRQQIRFSDRHKPQGTLHAEKIALAHESETVAHR